MSNSYWRRRSLEYERELSARCQSELEAELAKYFKESLSEIEKDIAALYGKFARDNKLSYSDAQKLIRGAEFNEWRMSLKEYVALSHTNSKILKELNTLAMRSRISRLEKLYSDTLKELQNLGEKYDKVAGDFLRTAYTDRYTRGVYDLATVGKLEIPVAKVQPAKLEKVLAQRWAGGNYSTRIWKNTEKLSKVLKSTITQGLHRGLSVQKLSASLSKEMDVSYKNAERLVRTELNFVSNMAARDSLQAAGLEEYEYIATAGPRTCSTCSNLNGTVHLLAEYSPGTNAPPMHPRCRCTISVVVSGGKRTAKDSSGKNIKVPAEMRYADYKAVYLDRTVTFEQWRSEKIKTVLQVAMIENKIKGELEYPPPKMDLSEYKFDAEHTQGDKHPHAVTEEEARQFIEDAYFMIKKWNGKSYNYYGREGAAFVLIGLKTIRTAFKREEYDLKIQRLIEVYENEYKKLFES